MPFTSCQHSEWSCWQRNQLFKGSVILRRLHNMWALRLSGRCCWRCKSPWASLVVTNDPGALMFTATHVFLDYLTMKMMELRLCETLITVYQSIRCNIAEDLNISFQNIFRTARLQAWTCSAEKRVSRTPWITLYKVQWLVYVPPGLIFFKNLLSATMKITNKKHYID